MSETHFRTNAYAKCNLSLRVLGRDPAGWHRLETVFQTIALHDVLRLRLNPGPAHTRCPAAGPHCPEGPDNLAWRAVESLRAHGADLGSVTVEIEKHIPSGGGLGGGSADAAAVLRCLAHRLPAAARHRLPQLALDLGADVPFLLRGGRCHALGRGDILDPLPPEAGRPLWLVLPGLHCDTGAIFRSLSAVERAPASAMGRVGWQQAWAHGAPAGRRNDLLAAACRVQPALQTVIAWLDNQRSPWGLSGSGSSCWLLAPPSTPAPAGCRVVATRFSDPRARTGNFGAPR